MGSKRRSLWIAISAVYLIGFLFDISACGQKSKKALHVETKTVTLFSRIKYKTGSDRGYGLSAFSFYHGVRSDKGYEVTRNNYELIYGSIDINGDRDWFGVSMVTDDRSRIKDLREWDWTEVLELPLLSAKEVPHAGFRSPDEDETFERSSDGQVTRAAVGHVYLIHTKDRDTGFFTLFRVEQLVPGDNVTISWKRIPFKQLPGRKP